MKNIDLNPRVMVVTTVQLDSVQRDYDYENGLCLNFVDDTDNDAEMFLPDKTPQDDYKLQLHVADQGPFQIGRSYTLTIQENEE